MTDTASTYIEVNEKLKMVLELLGQVDSILTMEAEQNQDKSCEIMSQSINAIWIEVHEQLLEFNGAH
jgi:hypothetical protein